MNYRIATTLLGFSGLFIMVVGVVSLTRLILLTDYSIEVQPGYAISHVGYTNLIASGLTWLCLTKAWCDKQEVWTLMLLGFLILWVGLNDSFAVIRLFAAEKISFPFAVIPTVCGLVGWLILLLSYKDKKRKG